MERRPGRTKFVVEGARFLHAKRQVGKSSRRRRRHRTGRAFCARILFSERSPLPCAGLEGDTADPCHRSRPTERLPGCHAQPFRSPPWFERQETRVEELTSK